MEVAGADFATGFTGDAAFAAGFGAGLGAGFFAGGVLVFDFVAVFDAITVLCRPRSGDSQKGSAKPAPPERIRAGSLGRGALNPD
jgi:hypothetical protein